MTHVPNSVVQGMLKNITDPKLRETYGNILNGNFPYKVYCMTPRAGADGKDKHKPGILIGYIDGKGRCIEEPTLAKSGQPIAGIETSRDRFDGRKGFRCYCGNWSIQAPEEQPVLGKYKYPVPPTKADLAEISERVHASGKTPGMVFIAGKSEYDGFMVELTKPAAGAGGFA